MKKILLAIDASGHSEAAIHEIACRDLPADSEVLILSVVEPAYFPSGAPGESVDMSLYAEVEDIARERARSTVEKAAAVLRTREASRPLTVTTKVTCGSPKRMILDAAEEFGADLIVVGSHGEGMVERFLLGSVSQAVALHAKCSVEIVRLKAYPAQR